MKQWETNQKIFEAICEKDLVDFEVLKEAFEICQREDKNLEQYLLKKGYIKSETISSLLDVVAGEMDDFYQSVGQVSLLETKEIGGFIIEKEIDRGGMGVVYLGKQKDIGRKVALKLMLKDSISNERERKRFLLEAEVTSKLNHPNIVPVYRVGFYEDQYPYFAMKFITGKTFDKLVNKPEISLQVKINILMEVCRGVEHAHEQGIIHRDLKPSNIMISDDQQVFLMDFGVAKELNRTTRLTKTGGVIGTLYYMSPEQVQNQELSYPSDIYSLGVILYQILTGYLPSVKSSVIDTCDCIIHENPRWPSDLKSEIPAALDAICRKAMAKSISQRYKSVSDFVADLENYSQGRKVSSMYYRFKSRYLPNRPILWQSLVAVILALLCGIVFLQYFVFYEKSAKEYWTIARKHYQGKKYDKSLDALEILVQKRPNFLPAQVLQSEIHYRRKNKTSLQAIWDRLLPKLNDVTMLKKISVQALNIRMLDESQRYAEKVFALKKDPDNVRLLQKLYVVRYRFADLNALYKEINLEDYPEFEIEKLWREKRWEKLQQKIRLLSENFELEGQKLFWDATVLWISNAISLNQVEWLLGKQGSGNFREKNKKLLDVVITKLKKAETYFSKETSLWQEYWSNLTQTYLQTAYLEMGSEEFFAISSSFTERTLAEQPFLKSVLTRYHLKRGDYHLALAVAKDGVDQFPWSASLRHLKALALLQEGKTESAIVEIRRCLKMDPFHVSSLTNFLSIITDNPSLERIRSLSTLVLDKKVSRFPLYSLFFQQEMDALFKEHRGRNVIRPLEKSEEELFISTVFESKSEQAQQIAIQQLIEPLKTSISNFEDLKQRITRRYPLEKYRSVWQKLNAAFEERYERFRQEELQDLLVKYSVLEEDIYIQRIQAFGEEGEKVLWKILHQKSFQMLRLIAARALVAYRHQRVIELMKNLAQSDNFPSNVIAMAALEEKKLLPLKPQSDKIMSRLKHEKNSFYHILTALHLFPFDHAASMKEFFHSKSEIISLAASYNLRLYANSVPGLPIEIVNKRIHRIYRRAKDNWMKTLALGTLWQICDSPQEPEKRDYESKRLWQQNFLLKKLWPDYSRTLVTALSDKSESLRLAASCLIMSNSGGFRYLFDRKRKGLEKVRELLLKGQEGSWEEKYWSINALGIIGTAPVMSEIFSDKTKTSITTTSFIYTVAKSSTKTLIKLFPVAKKLSLNPIETELDKKNLKLLTFSLAYFYPLLTRDSDSDPESFKKHQKLLLSLYHKTTSDLYQYYKNRSEEILDVLLISMSWHGQIGDIALIDQQLTRNFKTSVRKMDWITAQGAIASRNFSASKLEQIMEQRTSMTLREKHAFGSGVAQSVAEQILTNSDWLSSSEMIYDEEKYLQVFVDSASLEMAHKLILAAKWAPESKYYYLAALIYQREKKTDLAYQYIEKALGLYHSENHVDKKLLAKYLALQAEIAVPTLWRQILERAKNYDSTYSEIFRIGAERLSKEEKWEEAESLFWQAYLYGADNQKGKKYIYRYFQHLYEKQAYQKTADLMSLYHVHICTFYQKEIIRDFPILNRKDWIKKFVK